MSQPPLGSAVGSGVTCGSPWNRKGMVSRSVLSTNTKQASPESTCWHVKVQRATTVVGSAMRCITIISIAQFTSTANPNLFYPKAWFIRNKRACYVIFT